MNAIRSEARSGAIGSPCIGACRFCSHRLKPKGRSDHRAGAIGPRVPRESAPTLPQVKSTTLQRCQQESEKDGLATPESIRKPTLGTPDWAATRCAGMERRDCGSESEVARGAPAPSVPDQLRREPTALLAQSACAGIADLISAPAVPGRHGIRLPSMPHKADGHPSGRGSDRSGCNR